MKFNIDKEIEQLKSLILHEGKEKIDFYFKNNSILGILEYLDTQIEKLHEELLEWKYSHEYDLDPVEIERKYIHRVCALHKIGDCAFVLVKLISKINNIEYG